MKKDFLLEEASSISDWIIKLRRKFHSQPELSNHEYDTALIISKTLTELGFDVINGVGGEGVVGLLTGHKPGKTIALRADMDALPINETNDIVYKSHYHNRMHACGHDGHMAILLGAAKILTENKKQLKGKIKFVFQPAEELPPEGGAKGMIESNVLKAPDVDAIFGLHIWPELSAGQVGVCHGPIMAAADRFQVKIVGKGAHGAAPHYARDVISATAQLLFGLQTIISRRINPLTPAVLSVCNIHTGTAYNIMPDEAVIEGTTRYFNNDFGFVMKKMMEDIIEGICVSSGCQYQLDYQFGFPPTINDKSMADLVERSASEVLGINNVIRVNEPSMTGEDFSRFLEKVPGCYFWLGTNNPKKGITSALHQSDFQLDEDILHLGAAVFSNIVFTYLNSM